MKKVLVLLVLSLALCFTACGEDKDTTNDVDEFAELMQQSGATWAIEPSESVMQAMAGKWVVVGSEDVYELKSSGIGKKNDERLTFECGFNEDKKITMCITMNETDAYYKIGTDSTGHGVALTSLDGGDDMWFLPSNLEFLELDDARAEGIVGEWSDASNNKYILDENKGLLIKGKNGESEGTYSVVEDSEGTMILTLVVNGSALQFEYALNDAKNEMTLINLPKEDSSVEHVWTK